MENTGKKMLEGAQILIKKTAKDLGYSQDVIDRLIAPDAIHEFNFSVRMDNGKNKLFKGFRIQHNNACGPYKGGIRFHPGVTREEVQALATLMSIKCSVAGLPYGGGKGGVVVDPKELSKGELERVSRAYAADITPVIGVDIDVPAPDVNTNPTIMEWMVDEYTKISSKIDSLSSRTRFGISNKMLKQVQHDTTLRATFTGKPIKLGGSLGRTEATGRGGVIVLQALLSKLKTVIPSVSRGIPFEKDSSTSVGMTNHKSSNLEFPRPTVAVQGFGNVGYYFAEIASEEGFRVVAVSDSKGGIVKVGSRSEKISDSGRARSSLARMTSFLLPLDIPLVMKCKKEKGSLAGCYCAGGVCDTRGGQLITNEELLELPVDILVPSALENVINAKNMKNIKAKIIVEMANGPLTEEAYEYLSKKGVIIVPDVLANSGGVSVSYLEWMQEKQGKWWSEKEVNTKLEEIMKRAFDAIWKRSVAKKIPLKKAAFEEAIEKIVKSS